MNPVGISYVDPSGTSRLYPQSFDLEDLARLKKLVLSRPRATMVEVVGDADLAAATIVRHDVDHSLDHALAFARWEAERGIAASYFVLHTAWYFRDFARAMSRCREIEALGHEVGLHHDATTAIARDESLGDVGDVLTDVLVRMRDAGIDVRGCAAHASDLSLDNLGVWSEWSLQDFDLEYEAYHVHAELRANYVSDNRGRLRAPLEHQDGRPTHLLVHCEHWQIP